MVPVLLGEINWVVGTAGNINNDIYRLLLSVLGRHHQSTLLWSGSFPPHGREDKKR